MPRLAGLLGALVLGAVAAAPVVAEEAKSQVSVGLILNTLRSAGDPQDTAFDASLKEPGPAPRRAPVGEVLPGGRVRYGNVTVTATFKNSCPPGTAYDEPLPLPGRRLRK